MGFGGELIRMEVGDIGSRTSHWGLLLVVNLRRVSYRFNIPKRVMGDRKGRGRHMQNLAIRYLSQLYIF